MKGIFVLLLVGGFFSPKSWAFPEAPFDALRTEVARSLQSANYDFNGIVTLSNCSASLVHFVGQPKTSQAYVLTNGHCISSWGGFLRPGEIRWNKRTRRSMKVHKTVDATVRGTANLLAYAAMTDTDAALYRLNETYEYFEKKGIRSFELSSQRPLVNERIEIVSGYWKTGFSCFIESFVHELHEGGWVFKDSVRYSDKGCEVYGGTSGSPVLSEGARRVVAVNNTGNESGRMCTNNNPCEVDQKGNKTIIKGRGYAQQTYQFYSCLDVDFTINLNLSSCRLAKP